MTIITKLMLAGLTGLSLGMGTAMAQEGGNTYPVAADYWAPSSIAARQAQTGESGQVQSGSADVTPTHPDTLHSIPNWRDLPNYTDPG
jgi:hypothetical protein